MRKRDYSKIQIPLELIRLYPDQDHIQSVYRQYMVRRLMDMNCPDDEERVRPYFADKSLHWVNIMAILNDMRKNVYEDGYVRVILVSKILWGDSSHMIFPKEIVMKMESINHSIRRKYEKFRLEPSLLGSVVLKGIFMDRIYEFIMSPLQATLILFLQTISGMDWEGLQKALQLPEEGREACQILTSTRLPLLQKNEQGLYQINHDFSSSVRLHRVKDISLAPQKKIVQISDSMPNLDYQIDAKMIRLMKIEKTMTHQDLIVRTGQAIKIQDVRRMKDRIAFLIERDYIGRHETDPCLYHYIP
jgi:hypothetical protein